MRETMAEGSDREISEESTQQISRTAGETDLAILLRSMQPILQDGEYVFCTLPEGSFRDLPHTLDPIGLFRETEGLTLILSQQQAEAANLPYTSIHRLITLSIYSSLEAVGFLAAITHQLAAHQISVNPVSAYYHDHLFVPAAHAEQVMELLMSWRQ